MTWQQFEALVAEHFRRQGYSVSERGGAGPDGGIDLELGKDGERFLVQCKQWRANRVGVDVVRELYGLMAARGAADGYVVSAGTFTPEALAFAQGRNIHLLDGAELAAGMRGVAAKLPAAVPQEPAIPQAVNCPKCGAPMVRRVARQGKRAGEVFWGCSSYPACHGIRPA